MRLQYTTRCCSTARAVITTALYHASIWFTYPAINKMWIENVFDNLTRADIGSWGSGACLEMFPFLNVIDLTQCIAPRCTEKIKCHWPLYLLMWKNVGLKIMNPYNWKTDFSAWFCKQYRLNTGTIAGKSKISISLYTKQHCTQSTYIKY